MFQLTYIIRLLADAACWAHSRVSLSLSVKNARWWFRTPGCGGRLVARSTLTAAGVGTERGQGQARPGSCVGCCAEDPRPLHSPPNISAFILAACPRPVVEDTLVPTWGGGNMDKGTGCRAK